MAFVAQPTNLCKIGLVDFNGKKSTTEYFVQATEVDPGGGAPAALALGVQGVSNSLVNSVEVQIYAVNNAPGTAGTGPYDRVQDKLELQFLCDDGSTVTLQIPGPKQTVLLPNNFDVDPSDPLVAALVAAMIANGKSAQGAAIVGLSRGYRRVPPRLKRR